MTAFFVKEFREVTEARADHSCSSERVKVVLFRMWARSDRQPVVCLLPRVSVISDISSMTGGYLREGQPLPGLSDRGVGERRRDQPHCDWSTDDP